MKDCYDAVLEDYLLLSYCRMAGKFVESSVTLQLSEKSNALLKKRFASFQAAISYEYISEILCNLKL